MATVWFKGGRDHEPGAELVVEATMKVIRHKPGWGFAGFVEYRLIDAVVTLTPSA
jgi:hypothetical protein